MAQSKNNIRVLVVAGASGGHIFPAVSFIDRLNLAQPHWQLKLVLPQVRKSNPFFSYTGEIEYLPISALRLSVDKKNLIAILNFIKGSFRSLVLLIKFKPDLVVGFGSVVSLPLVLGACFLRIKTLIHEQNVIPGKANRLLAKFVDEVAISFLKTKEYLGIQDESICFTGNPLRKELVLIEKKAALDYFDLSADKKTLLVVGGSQGSLRVNRFFASAMGKLKDKDKLQVIHLSGNDNAQELKDIYKSLGVNARVCPFLNEMQYAYSAADLIISRAGAMTVSEIKFYKLPAIVIPYPFAYKHQLANAKELNSESSVIIEDGDLENGILTGKLKMILSDPDALSKMRAAYLQEELPLASDLLVKESLELLA